MLSAPDRSQALAQVPSRADSTVVAPSQPAKYESSVQANLIKLSAQRLVKLDSKVTKTGNSPVAQVQSHVMCSSFAKAAIDKIWEQANSAKLKHVFSLTSRAEAFSSEIENPPIEFEEEEKLEKLKVLAARALRLFPLSKEIDYKALRQKLGVWFPPLPTSTEHSRLFKELEKFNDENPKPRNRRESRLRKERWAKIYEERVMRVPAQVKTSAKPKDPNPSPQNAEAQTAVCCLSAEPLTRVEALERNTKILLQNSGKIS